MDMTNSVTKYLDNGVHRTSLLAEATVDALGHVDVISGGASATICPSFRLNGDGLGGAHSLTQLACDAPLLAVWVPPQNVLAAEARTDGPFLKGIVERDWFSEEGTPGDG